jgi:hypothetical protein
MPHSAYTGATIADMRRIGVSAFIIECAALYCYHQARIEFDALRLPDELSSLDVTKHRRFVCTKCGARAVNVMPGWRKHNASRMGRWCDCQNQGMNFATSLLMIRPSLLASCQMQSHPCGAGLDDV